MKKYTPLRQDLRDCKPLCQKEYNFKPEISELLCMKCTLTHGASGAKKFRDLGHGVVILLA